MKRRAANGRWRERSHEPQEDPQGLVGNEQHGDEAQASGRAAGDCLPLGELCCACRSPWPQLTQAAPETVGRLLQCSAWDLGKG